MDTTMLPIDLIALNGGTQPRAGLNEETVVEYAERMAAGDTFPAIEVVYDGTTYWLWDGFHRHAAAKRAGKEVIAARVQSGTQQDAVWFSFRANRDHGLRRSTADKRRAIEGALRHPTGAAMSNRQLAEYLGVDHKTVGAVREALEGTGEIPRSTVRTTADGRTMETAGIRTANAARAEVSAAPHAPDPRPASASAPQLDTPAAPASGPVPAPVQPLRLEQIGTALGQQGVASTPAVVLAEIAPGAAGVTLPGTPSAVPDQAALISAELRIRLLQDELRRAQANRDQAIASYDAAGLWPEVVISPALIAAAAQAVFQSPAWLGQLQALMLSATVQTETISADEDGEVT